MHRSGVLPVRRWTIRRKAALLRRNLPALLIYVKIFSLLRRDTAVAYRIGALNRRHGTDGEP